MALPTAPDYSWSLDEASGSRIARLGGEDLTDINTVGQTTGKVSNGADFVIANSETLETGTFTRASGIANDWTFMAWVYVTALGDNKFVSYINGSATDLATVRTNSGHFYMELGSKFTISLSQFSANTWYHIAAVYDGGGATNNDITTLYKNGSVAPVTAGWRSAGQPTSITLGTIKMNLGSLGGTSGYMGGNMDEVHIWAKALTASEISSVYTAENAGTGYPWTTGGGSVAPLAFHHRQQMMRAYP